MRQLAEKIRQIWTERQWAYLIPILTGIGFLVGFLFFPVANLLTSNARDVLLIAIQEVIGIAVTVGLIDRLNHRRDKRNAIEELKKQLIRDAGSAVNDVANNAVHQLRQRGWLMDDEGVLAGKDLREANLQEVNLDYANLQETDLREANLQGVSLWNANLQRANLKNSDLQGSILSYANLQGTNLTGAELQRANLWDANLQGANLTGAKMRETSLYNTNLQGANLTGVKMQGAILRKTNLKGVNLLGVNLENVNFGYGEDLSLFDRTTILPDDNYWTPDTDMTKFTKPALKIRRDEYAASQGN